MNVLHLLASGGIGGIEVLCKNIAINSQNKNIVNHWGFIFNEGKTYEYLKENELKIFSTANLNYRKKIEKIKEYCKRENIDIVVMHHGGLNCNRIYIKLKQTNPKIKFIRYMHACYGKYAFGIGKNIFKNLIIKYYMNKAIGYSDEIIYISKASKDSFKKYFSIKVKEKIIYNGVEKKFFEKNQTINNDKNHINIVFVGRFIKAKGIDLLVDAYREVIQSRDNIYLTLVGDGVEKNKIQEKVKQYKLENNVFFAGNQVNVIPWLDKAEIFIYPSICEEGFGISVVEAMARGCVPITFRKGALPEIIINEKNGYLVEEVDSHSLADKIKYACDDKNIDIIRKSAIEESNKFTIENTIQSLENEYINL